MAQLESAKAQPMHSVGSLVSGASEGAADGVVRAQEVRERLLGA